MKSVLAFLATVSKASASSGATQSAVFTANASGATITLSVETMVSRQPGMRRWNDYMDSRALAKLSPPLMTALCLRAGGRGWMAESVGKQLNSKTSQPLRHSCRSARRGVIRTPKYLNVCRSLMQLKRSSKMPYG